MEMVENFSQPKLRPWSIVRTLLTLLAVQSIVVIALHPRWFPWPMPSQFADAVLFIMPLAHFVIVLQAAVTAQSRWPARPTWYVTVGIVLAGACFSQLPLIINYFQLGIEQAPKLIATVIFTAGIQIVTCIILLRCLAHVCCVWLIAPRFSQANLIEQMTPIPWSIRGMMTLTFAIAVAITAGQRLNWSGFNGALLLQMLVMGTNLVCAGYLAAYFSSGGTRWMVAFAGMIALILLGAIFFMVRYLDDPTAFPNGIWMPVVFHLPHAVLSVLFHLWIFHLWKCAGFGVIGWTRANGFSPGSRYIERNLGMSITT